jgi:hypothetical protein
MPSKTDQHTAGVRRALDAKAAAPQLAPGSVVVRAVRRIMANLDNQRAEIVQLLRAVRAALA